MAAIGAFWFGAVLGWTAGFTAWTSRGVAYRSFSLGAVAASLTIIQADLLLSALTGVLAGGLAHEVFLAALVRRAR